MFWEAQRGTLCKVNFDQVTWPPLEANLTSNQPPTLYTFLSLPEHTHLIPQHILAICELLQPLMASN